MKRLSQAFAMAPAVQEDEFSVSVSRGLYNFTLVIDQVVLGISICSLIAPTCQYKRKIRVNFLVTHSQARPTRHPEDFELMKTRLGILANTKPVTAYRACRQSRGQNERQK